MSKASNGKGKTVSVVGLSWGDEGKGKLIDWLMAVLGFQVGVRFNGGNNAGHSVYLDNRLIHLHFIPSTIVCPNGIALLGAGELLEPFAFLNEKLYLKSVAGVNPEGRIFLDPRMSLIMFYHRIEDMAREVVRSRTSGGNIGTTAKGIGPAYADLAQRTEIRLQNLLGDPNDFTRTFKARLEEKLRLFFQCFDITKDELKTILEQLRKKDLQSCQEIIAAQAIDPLFFDYNRYFDEDEGLKIGPITSDYLEVAERLKQLDLIRDIALEVSERRFRGQDILFEGGQGSLLDVIFGTRPYVTSSHPIAGSACTGTPVGPTFIENVIGVAKLFFTRVGSGPFPTEDDQFGQLIRGTLGEPGAEFGTTTQRPRRCGPFDAVATRTTALWSGIHQLCGTKLDFLDSLTEIKVCTQYELDGVRLEMMPLDPKDLARVIPIYETRPGWRQDTTKSRQWSDLPLNARHYLDFVLENCQPPVSGYPEITWHTIGVGPNREQMIPVNV